MKNRPEIVSKLEKRNTLMKLNQHENTVYQGGWVWKKN